MSRFTNMRLLKPEHHILLSLIIYSIENLGLLPWKVCFYVLFAAYWTQKKTKFKKILKNIQKFQKPMRNTWVNMSAIFHFHVVSRVSRLAYSLFMNIEYETSLWLIDKTLRLCFRIFNRPVHVSLSTVLILPDERRFELMFWLSSFYS